MAHNYPRDRFDEVPRDLARVGAHRAPTRRGRGWIGFGVAVLATAVLVAAGVVAITMVNGSLDVPDNFFEGSGQSSTTSSTPTPTETITPTVDPSLTVIVLNGTTVSGLAGDVVDTLKDDGWKKVQPPLNADETDLSQTVVYYSDAADKAAALGVAASLKPVKVTTQETDKFADTGADLAVVVGSDYSADAGS